MKNTLIALTTAVSLILSALPLFALAEDDYTAEPAEILATEPTTVGIPPETLPQNGSYNGYFKRVRIDGKAFDQPRTELWVGETLDTSAWELIPCYLTPDKNEKLTYRENLLFETAEYPENDGLPVNAPEYAHCFSIDTSGVDTSKTGYYWVTIRTIPGEKAVFHNRYDPDFSYEITMREYEFRVYVVVSERPAPSVFLNLRNQIIMDNEETTVSFGGNATADLTGSRITAEPEGIVEIGELGMPSPGQYQVPQATIKALKPGIVTLTGTTDSGLTATCTLEIRDHTFYLAEVGGYAGNQDGTYFYSEADQTAEFRIEDESIAKIIRIGKMGDFSEHYQEIVIELLKPGKTKLIAETPDGRKAVSTIHVVSDETTPFISEIIPASTTTTTTTATAVTVKKGDVNTDGTIDIMDVIRLNKSLLGIEKLTGDQSAAADVDGNRKVDSEDSLLVLKYVLEMIVKFETT